MRHVQSLTVGGVNNMRICKISAKWRGYDIVPVTDAKSVHPQHDEGYAYMR